MKSMKMYITKGIALLLLTLTVSCVSKKKYNEAVMANRNKTEELQKMEIELQHATDETKKLTASTSEELRKKQEELLRKENLIKEREAALQELKDAMSAQKDAVLNLKQQVCSALKCFSPDELTVTMKDGKLYVSMSDKLLFPSGSEAVNERGKEALEALSGVMASSDLEVMVEGHTDSLPINNVRNKDNWDLSVHRATGVARLMIQYGIKPYRIISCGRGQFYPVASNANENGRQQNRRTEIILAPKLDKLWKLTEEPATEGATSGR